ncbi:hypothetical protein BJV74DRAFT_815691 [Russula compacta]|nr:hypothetical protein BJV74DRAFT_815691 [Russula compacta]
MSLSLLSLQATIICDGKAMDTYFVQQAGASALSAYVASEAGKQFKVVTKHNATDFELTIHLYIDGERVKSRQVRAGKEREFIGLRAGASTVRPFKFQEVELVDPDVEDATIAPDMGTIELQAFRSRTVGYRPQKLNYHRDLPRGHISERSKKAGWHRVSTADEMPTSKCSNLCSLPTFLDPPGVRYASIKIFYRPLELLKAQGIVSALGVGNRLADRSKAGGKRHAEDDLPTLPKKRRASAIKEEAHSVDNAHALQTQIWNLQVSHAVVDCHPIRSTVARAVQVRCFRWRTGELHRQAQA